MDIPEISYDDLCAKFAASGKRPAEEGVFEITYRCNLHCVHCYCNEASLQRQADELSFAEICRLMDEAAHEGCLWCAFTGGEPLARADFFDLYRYAKKKGFVIAVLTNGVLIDEKAADFFARWPPRQIEISIYGMRPETHDSVTGVPGSFVKTMHAIELLRRRAIPMEIKTMVLKQNRHEIADIRLFARGIGAKFRYDHLVHCTLTGNTAPHAFRVSAAEAVDVDQELGDMAAVWGNQCKAYEHTAVDCTKLYTCGAGRAMFTINPYGSLQTCSFPGNFFYDLRKGSFHQGWREFIPAVTSRPRVKSDFACRDCGVRALCSQCPNWAYLETGDEEEAVPYICALFKERARRFGAPNCEHKEGAYAAEKSV